MNVSNLQHKDGIWWYDAPLPWWWHRCRLWTSWSQSDPHRGRCACGATYCDGSWFNKNETRKAARRRS